MIEYDNNTLLTIDDIKNAVCKVVKKHFPNINKVILFGSYSRGNAEKNSDVDLLISDSPECRSMYFLAFRTGVMEELKKGVDLFRYEDIDKNAKIYKSIKKDGVVIYG